jgi:hypothetical protein
MSDTVIGSPFGILPRWVNATTTAQAPVPQARVSPDPRSQTRMRRWVGDSCSTISVFTRSGNRG